MLRQVGRMDYFMMQNSVKIGSAALHTILNENLQVRKVATRWVPHCLSDEQKEQRVNWCQFMLQKFNEGKSKRVYDIVTGNESWINQFDPEIKRQSSNWIFPGENPPRKFRRSRSVGKKMVASVFSKTGHVATIQLEDRRTVNPDWYVNHCIPQVLQVWRNKRPRTGLRGLLWHPDLAFCGSFLFLAVKEKICRTKFDSADDAVCAFNEAVSDLAAEQWAHCFDMWFYPMRLCVEDNGEYFEKL
ncbi:uncharacterized protein LOC135695728 [Rhopilema esculentum]|uniref:uncharacterized protein LOC135695728 n=1 Tax=Rhopilema esculentum TaxID=499914 RepID=UPI0031D4C137